jgi:hypothetical protein
MAVRNNAREPSRKGNVMTLRDFGIAAVCLALAGCQPHHGTIRPDYGSGSPPAVDPDRPRLQVIRARAATPDRVVVDQEPIVRSASNDPQTITFTIAGNFAFLPDPMQSFGIQPIASPNGTTPKPVRNLKCEIEDPNGLKCTFVAADDSIGRHKYRIVIKPRAGGGQLELDPVMIVD